MWTLTVDAGTLLSVVQFDPKKAPAMAKEHGANDGGDYLLIRARVKQSLGYVADVLEAIYLGEIEGWTKPLISDDKTADYRYRMILHRDEWKRYLVFEVDGIDYSSHVKEETVKRQPEPKIGNLYSALSATWSAWSKLQPTAPYSGLAGKYSGWNKPACKNCDHPEISHTIKGDKCNKDAKWDNTLKAMAGGTCDCTKYEPKPKPIVWRDCTCGHGEKSHKYELRTTAPDGTKFHNEDCMVATCECRKYEQKPAPAAPAQAALPAGKSAAESAAVFSSAEAEAEHYESAYPAEVWGSDWDTPSDEYVASSAYDEATNTWHAMWCVFWDGDSCICGEVESPVKEAEDEPWAGTYVVTKPAVEVSDEPIVVEGGLVINGKFVIQEPHVPGETRQESKNRLARNRRARRRAKREVVK